MPRSGTLVICVQNLDFSGANQVVLNIVSGKMHESNVVVLSPKVGTFAARFVASGAAVRVGNLGDLLNEIRDVFCIICNTIMTANIVCEMSVRPHPVIWILHEWWDDDMIVENLRIRNYEGLTLATVKQALAKAAMVVSVCESQRQLYQPSAPSSVIFVGVPDPCPRLRQNYICDMPSLMHKKEEKPNKIFTFLCLGIICPRKNQLWTVQMFKLFAKDRTDVRLQVVGARYTRVYEMEYLDLLKQEIGNDPRIELYDVTENVDSFYQSADCLLLTSLNEVTPMVISEAMSWGLPVISTNIAGIKEMYTDGVEGFHFAPGDEMRILRAMQDITQDPMLRNSMAKAARARFETAFDLDLMVESYRQLVLKVAPPVILLDMDGALLDWDKRFMQLWADRSPLDRSQSYFMEDCVPKEFRQEAIDTFMQPGFFEYLEPMEGALEALKEMEQDGLKLYICSAPLKFSKYCAQEKLNWVMKNLGEKWLDRTILCQDKTMVAGDILIDDKPFEFLSPGGKHTTAAWKQIVFDAPYNRQLRLPRMFRWRDWRNFLYPMLGKAIPSEILSYSQDEAEGKISMDPYRRPQSIGLSCQGLRRNESISSIHSAVSAEEVQKQMDMLQQIDTPLNVEDIATIVSGSLSLVGEDSSDEESLYEEKLKSFQQSLQEEGGSRTGKLMHPSEMAQKKKVLQDKLQQRSNEYKKTKEMAEKKIALDSDSNDMDGLQLFRASYELWKRIWDGKSHCSTPPALMVDGTPEASPYFTK